jgi:DNA-binding transcriptional ArsR family regulator
MVERLTAPPPNVDPAVLDGVFRALGDRTRRDMLRRLAAGERTISELAEPLDMSFAAASKHVRVLERAGLVHRNVRGRTHHCRLETARLAEAQQWLGFYQRFWMDRFAALDQVLAARSHRKPPQRKP